MFTNIGHKIMTLAKVLCWIGMALSLISGITMIVAGNNAYTQYGPAGLAGALVIIIGCLGSWIGSFVLYGFGQLIENSEEIKSKLH